MTAAEASESLAILRELERFLIEEVGGGGGLTLDRVGDWADQVRDVRARIAGLVDYLITLKG
jgi:hypothetical protein